MLKNWQATSFLVKSDIFCLLSPELPPTESFRAVHPYYAFCIASKTKGKEQCSPFFLAFLAPHTHIVHAQRNSTRTWSTHSGHHQYTPIAHTVHTDRSQNRISLCTQYTFQIICKDSRGSRIKRVSREFSPLNNWAIWTWIWAVSSSGDRQISCILAPVVQGGGLGTSSR